MPRHNLKARSRKPKPTTKVGAMVLAHNRPWLLPLIVQQVKQEWPHGVVQITADRPSASVVDAIHKITHKYPGVDVFEAPHPAVESKDRFMELRNFQLEHMRKKEVEFAAIWDDDHILEFPREMEKYMAAGYDMVYAKKVFFWDAVNLYNEKMPEHNSVFFFRVLPDDKFPLDRIIHAPVGIHDNPLARIAHPRTRLLDIGYLLAEDRERVFKTYARAGKLDPATLPLMDTPSLREYRPNRNYPYWYSELRNVLRDVCNPTKPSKHRRAQ